MVWERLDAGWRAAFTMAWEAFCTGTIPIGAAIVNQKGEVVAQDRNRIYNNLRPANRIAGHQLAHAETNCILQLPESQYPDIREYTLYTTMEPCPFCFGAVIMGSIRHVKVAAMDAWAGATAINELLPYAKGKNITIDTQIEPAQTISVVLEVLYSIDRLADDFYLKSKPYCPHGVRIGERLCERKVLQQMRDSGATIEDVIAIIEREMAAMEETEGMASVHAQ